MSETVCTIGVDFGTESGRVLVLDLDSGEELAVHVVAYAHGVIDRHLIGTDRNEVRLVEQDVRGLQKRIAEEAIGCKVLLT